MSVSLSIPTPNSEVIQTVYPVVLTYEMGVFIFDEYDPQNPEIQFCVGAFRRTVNLTNMDLRCSHWHGRNSQSSNKFQISACFTFTKLLVSVRDMLGTEPSRLMLGFIEKESHSHTRNIIIIISQVGPEVFLKKTLFELVWS